ncbi:hypothetical protein HDV00_008908 [Rhizophlyctis rosea]|nr:hypothetical protein HDV00_008908 [Rhizophlyctis rosea]
MVQKVIAASFFVTLANAASLVDVSNFGSNPTNLKMSIYVPDRPQPKAPIVLTMHGCQGNGKDFFTQSEWPSLADKYGFIVISPTVPSGRTWGPGGCWITETEDSLAHGGGSDSLGLVNMINWAVTNKGGDASRVYSMGWSSGAMNTQLLMGAYPDVFKAGAAFDGVPYGCMLNTASDPSQNVCAQGQLIKSAQEWGDLARSGYPGYSGARPKVQVWHGTNDQVVNYKNLGESVKQWTNIHGISATAVSTTTPVSGWSRQRFGNGQVEAWTQQESLFFHHNRNHNHD